MTKKKGDPGTPAKEETPDQFIDNRLVKLETGMTDLHSNLTSLEAGVSNMAAQQSMTDTKLLDELIALMAGRQNTAAGGLGSEVRPENALVEQQRLRREERERTKVQARAAEEQARREREAQENFLERSKWLVGKWNTPDGVLSFIDTDLDSGFHGQNGETPFLCFTKSSEEDENRLQFEWDGKPIYATVDGETLLWDDGDTYTRHDEQKEEQRIQREQVKEKLAGQWETFEALALRGHENGNALFQDLDVYMPGSDTPFLWFVEIDLNGCLIYEYDDDQRILAWFDGDRDDVLKWSDGSIYWRGYDVDPDPELETTATIDFEHIENIAREPIPGAGNATTPRKFFHGGYLLPRVSTFVDSMLSISQIDPYGHSHQIIHDTYQSVVQRDKEGSDTGDAATLPHDWGDDSTGAEEFTIPRKFFQGFGNSTAETAATCLGHHGKDQNVDSGATYCFYLYGYFDLAKEWESQLQGYNELVKEWESKLQGYNEVSYQLHRPWKRPRFG